MKQKIFTKKSVNEFADFLLEISESEGVEDDFITDMLSQKMTRMDALNTFKESIMIYYSYIKFCLIEEDYECADKFKTIIDIEFNNTVALLDKIGEITKEDEIIMCQIIQEVNDFITQNLY
jgi:hypothetical protein